MSAGRGGEGKKGREKTGKENHSLRDCVLIFFLFPPSPSPAFSRLLSAGHLAATLRTKSAGFLCSSLQSQTSHPAQGRPITGEMAVYSLLAILPSSRRVHSTMRCLVRLPSGAVPSSHSVHGPAACLIRVRDLIWSCFHSKSLPLPYSSFILSVLHLRASSPPAKATVKESPTRLALVHYAYVTLMLEAMVYCSFLL